MKPPEQKRYNLFAYLLLLTGFFFCAELSFFFQWAHFYFRDFHFIAHRIAVPPSILPGILFFIFSEILIHLSFAVLIYSVASRLASLFKSSAVERLRWGLLLWFLGILLVLVANQYFFPNSRFSDFSRQFFPDRFAKTFFLYLASLWSLLILLLVYDLARMRAGRYFLLVLGFIFAVVGYKHYQAVTAQDAGTPEKPNIILIGIDSLRPDYLGFFGSSTKTTYIDGFLKRSTVFSKTFTPIARTFPSWIAILSGEYPKESGIRFNLANPEGLDKKPLLPTLLKAEGYQTIFATDETQFSNIDQGYGFDKAITPPMGLNDFLIGAFNDFPLSNLVVNTWAGHWLFPHNYGNRPSYMTYSPNSFLALLKPALQEPRPKPLFLSVHFCLTHYPYLWKAHAGFYDQKPTSRYQASIRRVDRQVRDFMAMLEQYQVLQHAVVVLLSDHGEAFELPGDRITAPASYVPLKEGQSKKIPRFYPPSADKEAVNQSAGHGTDVLGFSQYQTLLAFRLYGLGEQSVKTISTPALLLDIKPTVLEFLGLHPVTSGLSWYSSILGKSTLAPKRAALFLESDYSPSAVRSVHPETRNVVFEGIELFRIDPKTTRILVKDSMGKLIISSKQYADVEEEWVLALYPQAQGEMIPVLVHLPSGLWTTDLSTAFAQKSPQLRMIAALRKFYGKEIKQIVNVH